MIPPIRLLYSDDNNDDLSIQLQIADHQSSLSWETVLNILDDEIRFGLKKYGQNLMYTFAILGCKEKVYI